MNTKYCKAGIKRTIKKLDDRVPKWRNLINIDTLDMGDGCDCVLGQIYSFFEGGLEVLDIPLDEAHKYGLTIKDITTNSEGFSREYQKLTQLWKEMIVNE